MSTIVDVLLQSHAHAFVNNRRHALVNSPKHGELAMLRFKLGECLDKHQFKVGRKVELLEVAEKSGVSRATLSKLINRPGAMVRSDVLDRLCQFFECQVGDLVEYVPQPPKKSKR
jgi:putative transcriptional regulator